jgi:capsid protein
MSALGSLRSFFTRRPADSAKPAGWFHRGRGGEPPEAGDGARRWKGAKTHRLNQHQWLDAGDGTLNDDLVDHLADVRNRCCLEAARNSTVAGMIQTHVVDMVGETGPQLHVQSESAEWNTWAEQIWGDWWNPTDLGVLQSGHTGPDLLGRQSGPELLSLWIKSLWKCGEFFAQPVTDETAPGPIKLRVNSIHPRRIGTPAQEAAEDIVLGVKVTQQGKPLGYFVGKPDATKAYILALQHDYLLAQNVLHGFIVEEDLQLRGVPWLATSLQDAADLDQYDADVLEAADQAAAMGVAWYSDHPEAPYLEINESTAMRRGQQYTGPPGWKPMQINASQPSAQYVEFRKERKADLGRPVSMPQMIVRLTAERHTYSSARLDMSMYGRALEWFQAWLGRAAVLPLVVRLLREAELAAGRDGLPPMPTRPPRIPLYLTWPKLPHVDPQKERNAERMGFENGTLPYAEACAAQGNDESEVIGSWRRTNQKRTAEGLDPLPLGTWHVPKPGTEPGGDKDPDDDPDDPDEKDDDDGEEE